MVMREAIPMRAFPNFEVVPLSEVPAATNENIAKVRVTMAPVVLVVADEEIIADTRSAILSGWGYSVRTAYSAERALELAREEPPRYLVTNVKLSRMNGVDLAFAIRTLATDCRVVLFSGETDSFHLIEKARKSSQDFTFLQKPIHPGHLRPLFPNVDENA
jgi:DNA-binding NtrC family response regulator